MVAALAVFAAFASGFAWRSSHGLRSGWSVEADKAADLQARGAALELLDEALRAQREQRINGALSALDRARRTDPSLPGVDVSFAALALGEKQLAEMRTAAMAAKAKNDHAAAASVLLGMDKWIARGPSDREMSAAADAASAHFAEATESDYFFAPAWFFWGDVLRYAGREDEGRAHAFAALHRFNPWDSSDVIAVKIVLASGESVFAGFGVDDGSPLIQAASDLADATTSDGAGSLSTLAPYAARQTLTALSDETFFCSPPGPSSNGLPNFPQLP